jgi:hypothetical protein
VLLSSDNANGICRRSLLGEVGFLRGWVGPIDSAHLRGLDRASPLGAGGFDFFRGSPSVGDGSRMRLPVLVVPPVSARGLKVLYVATSTEGGLRLPVQLVYAVRNF